MCQNRDDFNMKSSSLLGRMSLIIFGSLTLIMICALVILKFVVPQYVANDFLIFIIYGALICFASVVVISGVSYRYVVKPLTQLKKTLDGSSSLTENSNSRFCKLKEWESVQESLELFLRQHERLCQDTQGMQERLVKAEEHLKLKLSLEEKSHQIQKMNTVLSGAFNDMALLYGFSSQLARVLEHSQLADAITRLFQDKIQCQDFAIVLQDREQAGHDVVVLNGDPSLLFNFIKCHVPLLSVTEENVSNDLKPSYYFDNIMNIEGDTLHATWSEGALFIVPFVLREKLLGYMAIYRRLPTSINATDRQSLKTLSALILATYDRCRLYARTKELSYRDELTGLYNRRYFNATLNIELKRAIRMARPVSVIMIDLDHFKRFNDTYGHPRGDWLLKEFSAILLRSLREIDVVARIGGEEFVVLLPDTAMMSAVHVAHKLRLALKEEIMRLMPKAMNDDGRDIQVTLSAGVASFPESAVNGDELLECADKALYASKHGGRDQVTHVKNFLDNSQDMVYTATEDNFLMKGNL